MSIQNTEIRDIFNQVADLMEIRGENPFRIRAYREAARVVGGMSEQMSKMAAEGEDLTKIRGIGKDLAEKIKEIVETGNLSYLEELKSEVPASLLDILAIPALGPRKVAALYRDLGITTVEELRGAAEEGRVAGLRGFGAKSQEKILASLGELKKEAAVRMLYSEVAPVAKNLEDYLRALQGIKKLCIAGSFRRGKETVGDLDILAACRGGQEEHLMQAFVDFEDVVRINAHGRTKSSVHLRSGLQVDLRIVPEASYGAALHYFTGAKAHNVAVRKLAVEMGLKINEYGVYEDDRRVAGETEEAVYQAVGLSYIEPELRENMGEIEAARQGALPELVALPDIRGDLHVHTSRTDGMAGLEEMAEAAKALGYEYIAITEHSQKVGIAGGLNERQVLEYLDEIGRVNEKIDGITLLKGMEVDIRADGSLDLSDSVLKELDLTVCSIHYHQDLAADRQTRRVLKAMENPYFTILGHPRGRLINRRKPMEMDMEAVIEAASERGVILEVNGQPDRLDLEHTYCKAARERGGKLAISTDAHSPEHFRYMKNGMTEGRRGWLTRDDVVNTLPLGELMKALRRG